MNLPMEVDGVQINTRKEMMELAETNEKAQMILCDAFYYGNGVPKDYKKSFYYACKAAENDNSQALLNLSYMYKKGLGCEVDFFKAEQCALKGEELGDEEAYGILGEMYMYGLGPIKQDIVKAICYIHKNLQSEKYKYTMLEEMDMTEENVEMMYQNIVVEKSLSQKELIQLAEKLRENEPEEYKQYEPEGLYTEDDYSEYKQDESDDDFLRFSNEAIDIFVNRLKNEANDLGIEEAFPYRATVRGDKEFNKIVEKARAIRFNLDENEAYLMVSGTLMGIKNAMQGTEFSDILVFMPIGIIWFDKDNENDGYSYIEYDEVDNIYVEDEWLFFSISEHGELPIFPIEDDEDAVSNLCEELTDFIVENCESLISDEDDENEIEELSAEEIEELRKKEEEKRKKEEEKRKKEEERRRKEEEEKRKKEEERRRKEEEEKRKKEEERRRKEEEKKRKKEEERRRKEEEEKQKKEIESMMSNYESKSIQELKQIIDRLDKADYFDRLKSSNIAKLKQQVVKQEINELCADLDAKTVNQVSSIIDSLDAYSSDYAEYMKKSAARVLNEKLEIEAVKLYELINQSSLSDLVKLDYSSIPFKDRQLKDISKHVKERRNDLSKEEADKLLDGIETKTLDELRVLRYQILEKNLSSGIESECIRKVESIIQEGELAEYHSKVGDYRNKEYDELVSLYVLYSTDQNLRETSKSIILKEIDDFISGMLTQFVTIVANKYDKECRSIGLEMERFVFQTNPNNISLKEAISDYILELGLFEKTILIHKSGFFAASDEGFMLTTKRILYHSKGAKAGIDLLDIANVLIRKKMLCTEIVLVKNNSLEVTIPAKVPANQADNICKILIQMINMIKNSRLAGKQMVATNQVPINETAVVQDATIQAVNIAIANVFADKSSIAVEQSINVQTQNVEPVKVTGNGQVKITRAEYYVLIAGANPTNKSNESIVNIRQFVFGLRNALNFHFLTFSDDAKFTKKSLNAINEYAVDVKEDDVILLMDDTVLSGNAKKGFLLTRNKLYWNNDVEAKQSCNLSDISRIWVFEKNKGLYALYITVNGFDHHIGYCADRSWLIARMNLIFDIISYVLRYE